VPGLRNSENSPDWIFQARANLMRRRTTKPASKAGQIWALWPEIEAARAGGQSMKSIHKWLQEDAGITLSFSSFTSYVSRIRRRLAATRSAETAVGRVVQPQAQSRSSVASPVASVPTAEGDPLAQAKRVLSQPKLDIRKLHNDGDPEGTNLI
jgi:hypothetical protein